jgi:Cytochrome C oxidase, cbb3-type, subunit III
MHSLQTGRNMLSNRQEQFASKSVVLMALSAMTAMVLTAVLVPAPGALAEELARGQGIWHDKAGCDFCHGWAGDGVGGFHHPGHPPSLRATALTRDQIRMTIQCGRPGTAMPYFDRFAYTDKRCYDMDAADVGDLMPTRASTTLQADEIDALADYVAEKIKGAGAVTRAECFDYFGGGTSRCDKYSEK